ncbi:uncharacterized protein LOC130507406 [Raphanus sativus]|uniref:Uncharacterized protein LOC108845394 n=1 Tax=Raphanus sativus TaxID=3726 RepID=A0A6J0MNR6_RAPSA|nr:uncharacterized protein LOC108845394 [Raphanus sativus]XP_056858103.1 uncharacterized protein LOC130507406 [Raphanus sativus]
MGIPLNATVADSMKHRRRSHRVQLLNRVEVEIERVKESRGVEEDVSKWKNSKGKYKTKFSTKETWLSIREDHPLCYWYKAVWFKHATPRYSFITWVAMRGRLATGDRMLVWSGNIDATCVLCKNPLETIQHLFFECPYSAQVWEALMKGVMVDQYMGDWETLIRLIVDDTGWSKVKVFVMRYMFQATIYMIWRERNRRRHGEKAVPTMSMVSQLDKNMRNQLTVIRSRGDEKFEGGMAYWFEAR